LWRAIFKIAGGSSDVVTALAEFMSSVPWQDLQAVPVDHPRRAWFHPGEHSVPTELTGSTNIPFPVTTQPTGGVVVGRPEHPSLVESSCAQNAQSSRAISPTEGDVPMCDLERPRDATPQPTIEQVFQLPGTPLCYTPQSSESSPHPSQQQQDDHSSCNIDITMVDDTHPNPDDPPPLSDPRLYGPAPSCSSFGRLETQPSADTRPLRETSPQRNDTSPPATEDMSPTHSPPAESTPHDRNPSPSRQQREDSDRESEIDVEMIHATVLNRSRSPPLPGCNTPAPRITFRELHPRGTQRGTGPPRELSVCENDDETTLPTPHNSKRKPPVSQTAGSNPPQRKRNKRKEKGNRADLPGKRVRVDSPPDVELEGHEVGRLVEPKQEQKPRFLLLDDTRFVRQALTRQISCTL
jgi:hypothetical protein